MDDHFPIMVVYYLMFEWLQEISDNLGVSVDLVKTAIGLITSLLLSLTSSI
jgi:hypothetical protein